MWKPKLSPVQLSWMTKAIIPFAIVCGFVGLALGTRQALVSFITWSDAAMLLLGELVTIGAICQLTYRLVRLSRLGDVKG